jgi:hypothetical protein
VVEECCWAITQASGGHAEADKVAARWSVGFNVTHHMCRGILNCNKGRNVTVAHVMECL